jgi:hypothetical protein
VSLGAVGAVSAIAVVSGGISDDPEEHQMVVGSSRNVLPCRDRLRIARSETLPSVVGNRAVDDGAAVNAFPGVEDEEEI